MNEQIKNSQTAPTEWESTKRMNTSVRISKNIISQSNKKSNNIFEEIKHRVNIIDAAERLGIQVDRHNKALCFVHNERHPSLSFKNDYFKCFSCGVAGDVISMVCHLKGVKPIEAARILDSLYGLNLFDNKVHIKQPEFDKTKLESWKAWEQWACNMVAEYLKQLDEWKRIYKPKPSDEKLHPLFAEALNKIEYWDYIYKTVFIEGDFTIKTEFYQTHRKAVDALDTTRKVRSA